MPLTNGKMGTTHERKIKKNLIYLKKNMDAKDLTDYFIQEEVFDFPDIDMIKGFNPNTTESRNDCFFKLLFMSGPNAYNVFLESLRINGQDFLADKIEGTHVEGGDTASAALGKITELFKAHNTYDSVLNYVVNLFLTFTERQILH